MYNILHTDGYKFSMAQAGAPLRPETFYLSFRRGGWQYIPFDLEAYVRELLPISRDEAGNPLDPYRESQYLGEVGYGLTPAMLSALKRNISITAAPAGSWVHQREPILSISGPSFLVSWLEPLVLRLFFPIQLATALMKGEITELRVPDAESKNVAEKVFQAVSTPSRFQGSPFRKSVPIIVEQRAYADEVQRRGKALVDILDDADRIFEVGMRAAATEHQHRIALTALKDVGIKATSNVALARELGLKPVGTMGHEHIQRWGNDLDAYKAMRDMREGVPSYLLDTFDTYQSGIPAAIKVASQVPHTFSIRYDSGDKFAQYLYAHGAFERSGLKPIHILEDGLDAAKTRRFEQLREFTGIEGNRQFYGYGGHLIARASPNPFGRDRVSAVYKLTESGGEPRMKWGNETGLGKQSIPGRPVVFRRLRGDGPISIIGQVGERFADYVSLADPDADEKLRICNVNHAMTTTICGGSGIDVEAGYNLSPATKAMIEGLR